MKASRLSRYAAVAAIAAGALALSACGSDNATGAQNSGAASESAGAKVTGTLTGVGSSAQSQAVDAWKAAFASANSGAVVQYSPDGSGAGRKAILDGSAQFGGSDAFLKEEEYTSSKDVCGPEGALNIPVYISPIAVAFNLPNVTELKLDAATLAKIFRGEISTWNDSAIAALNDGVELPDTKITPVHRSDDSGTTTNFTQYLSAAAEDVWTDKADGEWPSSLGGENAKGTSGVVKTVTDTEGGITYADESQVGSLGVAQIKVGDSFTTISAEAAAKAAEASKPVEGRAAADVSLELDRATQEEGVYPIVLVSYHVVCSSYKDQATVDLVKAFESYVVSEQGQQDAADAAQSAPLSDALRTKAEAAIESIKVAS